MVLGDLCCPTVELGLKLQQARTRAGLSVEEVAASLQITRAHIYALEKGKNLPSLDVLERIANLYGLLPGDLLPCTSPTMPELEPLLAALAPLALDARAAVLAQLGVMARTWMNVVPSLQTSSAPHSYKEERRHGGQKDAFSISPLMDEATEEDKPNGRGQGVGRMEARRPHKANRKG